MGVGGRRHTPAALYPRERSGTHCTGGWMGPRVGLDGYGKSRPHRDSIPGPSCQIESLYRLSYPAYQGSTGFRIISSSICQSLKTTVRCVETPASNYPLLQRYVILSRDAAHVSAVAAFTSGHLHTYLLTAWTRVLLEKLTSKLCS
jgi:hypothetical protein